MWYVGVIINVAGSLRSVGHSIRHHVVTCTSPRRLSVPLTPARRDLVSIKLSTNVIKLAHARLDELGEDGGTGGDPDGDDDDESKRAKRRTRKRPPWYNLRLAPNRLWLAAMIVFVVANLANFASFAFAAQSLLAALGSIQFVSNVVFARLVNKERITRQTVVGTLVIVAGCIVLVLFGSHDSPVYTVDDLLALYGNPGYIAYLCVGATVAVASYGAFWWIRRKTGRRSLALYVLFSAVVGTQSVLYGKSLSLLFRAALDGTNVAKHWYSWVCLMAFLAAAVYWVRRFNKVGFGFFVIEQAQRTREPLSRGGSPSTSVMIPRRASHASRGKIASIISLAFRAQPTDQYRRACSILT